MTPPERPTSHKKNCIPMSRPSRRLLAQDRSLECSPSREMRADPPARPVYVEEIDVQSRFGRSGRRRFAADLARALLIAPLLDLLLDASALAGDAQTRAEGLRAGLARLSVELQGGRLDPLGWQRASATLCADLRDSHLLRQLRVEHLVERRTPRRRRRTPPLGERRREARSSRDGWDPRPALHLHLQPWRGEARRGEARRGETRRSSPTDTTTWSPSLASCGAPITTLQS